jgi:hypothetical protein
MPPLCYYILILVRTASSDVSGAWKFYHASIWPPNVFDKNLRISNDFKRHDILIIFHNILSYGSEIFE